MPLHEDIEAKVKQQFKPKDWPLAFRALESCGRHVAGTQLVAVQMAVLKLANGDLSQLLDASDSAKSDYRDVLYWAYVPYEKDAYRMLSDLLDSLVINNVISDAERTKIIRAGGVTHCLPSYLALHQFLIDREAVVSNEEYELFRILGKRLRTKAIWSTLKRSDETST